MYNKFLIVIITMFIFVAGSCNKNVIKNTEENTTSIDKNQESIEHEVSDILYQQSNISENNSDENVIKNNIEIMNIHENFLNYYEQKEIEKWEETYDLINTVYSSIYYEAKVWGVKAEFIQNALTDIIEYEKGFDPNLEEKLTFLDTVTSEDKLIKIFSYELREGGTFHPYHSIVLYNNNSYNIVINLDGNIASNLYETHIENIYKIEEGIYLIYGWTTSASFSILQGYFTITTKNNTIESYMAFNNESSISYNHRFDEGISEIIYDENAKKIIVTDIDNNKKIFEYNGEKFIGDYSNIK